jgi:hypothetical protein
VANHLLYPKEATRSLGTREQCAREFWRYYTVRGAGNTLSAADP